MHNRLDAKLILLYTLLVLQVFIVMIYVATTPPSQFIKKPTKNSVSFVELNTLKNEVTIN